MKNQHVVLKHLDNPIRILSFSVPELISWLSPFFVGSLFDSMFVMPVIGLGVVFVCKRFLKRLPRFYLIRFWYWSLPTGRLNGLFKSSFPGSNKRYWVR
jgi:type IV conjugative transfer system protein TraL